MKDFSGFLKDFEALCKRYAERYDVGVDTFAHTARIEI
jgi:hypothetical protein